MVLAQGHCDCSTTHRHGPDQGPDLITCPLTRFLRSLAFVLVALVFLGPPAQAADVCEKTSLHEEWKKLPNANTQSWAYV